MNVYDVLRRDEGLRLKPYHCTAGALTIGYGRNLDAVGISYDEAEMMLARDVAASEREAAIYPWFAGLDAARRAVVVCMLFNLGAAGFRKFRATHAALARGDYAAAARQMLASKWAGQVGARAERLAESMRTGVLR